LATSKPELLSGLYERIYIQFKDEYLTKHFTLSRMEEAA
jgi:hypothetical protein